MRMDDITNMAVNGSSNGTETPKLKAPTEERARAYQMEMYEESLKRNIVVTMDTGSGKTHIAVLRIQAQLEKGEDKLCWFLVPNVSLGNQQYEVLKTSLPPVNIQFLSGGDKVDKWSDQEIWDEILGIKDNDYAVVVSTHQVLLDALTHGFVRIQGIGLIVFDEAHHCVGQHPANRIMQDFYHPRARKGLEVPAVLGLTASPVMKSTPDQLRHANLNAISRTPVRNRQELLRHVHPPILKRIVYTSSFQEYELIDPSILEGLTDQIDGNNKRFSETMWPEAIGPPQATLKLPKTMDSTPSSGAKTPDTFDTALENNEITDNMDEYEEIDPMTGEPYCKRGGEAEFEMIDPLTGEPYKAGKPGTPVPRGEEYELIDPLTGEPYVNPPTDGTNEGTDRSVTPARGEFHRVMEPDEVYITQQSTVIDDAPSALDSLQLAWAKMDIRQDPFLKALQSAENPDLERIEMTISKRNTYCQVQMRGLLNKAFHIRKEFGAWGVDCYLKHAIQKAIKFADEEDPESLWMEWNSEEKRYLKSILSKITVPKDIGPIEGRLSDKVEKLIEVLLGEYKDDGDGKFAGLIFVEQRVGVSILAKILKKDSRTKDIFRVGTVVGVSESNGRTRKAIYELVNLKGQYETIEDFRAGKKNLVVSTSVVEEGMDIPACRLVVCFSLPPNLKSFIQRRGRARMAKSNYVLMFNEGDSQGKIDKFKQLEMDMIEEYLDETRKLKAETETETEEPDEDGVISTGRNRRFMIESTGALLTLDSAVSHLHHFCNCLPQGEYMDLRPIFHTRIVNQEQMDTLKAMGSGLSARPLYKAEVFLPNCIVPEVRRAESREAWGTERWAKRDAAFEAYLALRQLQGDPLIDDHLMPLLQTDPDIADATKKLEKRPSKVAVDNTMDPWSEKKWEEDTVVFATPITLNMPSGSGPVVVEILTQFACPEVAKIMVYRTNSDIGEVIVGPSRCLGVNPRIIGRGKKTTYALLSCVFGSRMRPGVKDFPYLFVPKDEADDWAEKGEDVPVVLLDAYRTQEAGPEIGIIKDNSQNGVRYVFQQWRNGVTPEEHEALLERYKGRQIDSKGVFIEAIRLSGRRDFLHPESNEPSSESSTLLIPGLCTMDVVPWNYSQLAMYLPGIIRRIEMSFIAADLERTLLHPVGFNSIPKMVTALSASSAREPTDYQRLEFLGDSVLKFLTSVNLLDEHPFWHEGYLTRKKEQMVANSRLARAAIDKRLAKWIITDIFTGSKWRPRYVISEEEEFPERKRKGPKQLSTKILADVVESLIGAAYLEGGYSKALKVIRAFGLNINWKLLEERKASLLNRASQYPEVHLPHLKGLESLIGYNFTHKALLLEAITHPSWESDMTSLSYQRMEFLGDALLDMVVVNHLFFSPRNLSHIDMHLYKSSVVNGNFLAYLSLRCAIDVKGYGISQRAQTTEVEIVNRSRKVELWKFIRHQHQQIQHAQKICSKRYEEDLRDSVQTALDYGKDYPWTELSPLESDKSGRNKFLSDVVEAIIGAVFIDSGGNFETVKALAERLGILKVLKRLVTDRVDVTHPVKKLGEAVAANGQGTVHYVQSVEAGGYSCAVMVNEEKLLSVRAASRSEARTKAAELALSVFMEKVKNDKFPPGIARKRHRGEDGDDDDEGEDEYGYYDEDYAGAEVVGGEDYMQGGGSDSKVPACDVGRLNNMKDMHDVDSTFFGRRKVFEDEASHVDLKIGDLDTVLGGC
ncbi:P-loop containing nucleoside triphosphate hydrolase protein [Choiromyces venosus 120613-1]|uniref:P-loop containing nucleoside triphosphate hydrolase protein n=1 Tax=Choiromyces venosus 120613-1 TaxID=1336337 RepID=A0A3N4JJH7_9PEZI|nr:P-loop containing nucleoside triphosphate hydrolase protein [Choiromyces venosus 120613-1]